MLFILIILFKLVIFSIFKSKRDILVKYSALLKENQILQRKLKQLNKKVAFSHFDKIFYSLFPEISTNIKSFFFLVQPRTILNWYKKIIKKQWTFSNKKKKPGRPPVPAAVKQLILTIKNSNIFMRSGKIQGELLKVGIKISQSSIRRILRDFRKQGKVKSDITWSTFIKSQMSHIFAMDFLTVDLPFNQIRYYIFFIMHLRTRKIVQFGVTDIPSHSYVKNQLIEFVFNYNSSPYLIHDNAGEFVCQDYKSFGIKNIKTSPYAPNMNAHAERFVGSVRRELLNNFIIFSYDQLFRLFRKYILYYNNLCPHQGIKQQIPTGYMPQTKGQIVKVPILGGLWNHYHRVAA